MTPDRGIITSVVNGKAISPGEVVVTRENPGRTSEIAARWSAATPGVAVQALDALTTSFREWSVVPRDERLAALARLLGDVEAHAEDFAGCITREVGKTLSDSRSEIASALRDARFLLEDAQRDEAVPRTIDPSVCAHVALEPVGVFLLVTPWNFPLATILRKLVPALAYGNTAIVKPSELSPGPASILFAHLAAQEKLSAATALLLGRGPEIVPPLIAHPALRGVSFTGSTSAGLAIARQAAGLDIRLQLEMGGKNTAVVLEDADLDLAAAEIARGAFSCAGQWCTGTGRVGVHRSRADELVARLVDRAKTIRVGASDASDTEMGPVISAQCVSRTQTHIKTAVDSGASLEHGCNRDSPGLPLSGHFIAPTIVTHVDETMAIWTDELFAPVVPVAVGADDEQLVKLANAGRYGLSASVFSRDEKRALAVGSRIEAGMLHVNLHTAHRDPSLPVGGWRDSGRGIPECGRFARDFFTRPRAVYVRSLS